MSISAFHVVAVLCLGFPLVAAGSARECNTTVEGYTWRYDVEVDEEINGVPSADLCYVACEDDNDCLGYTWTNAGVISNCYKFKKQLRGIHECVACSSGVVPDQIQGACVGEDGDILDHGPAESVQECLQLCSETDDCQAYTWWDDTTPFINTCFLYGDCQDQLPCDGCASGKINCIITTLPDQCVDYMVLDEADRSVSNGGCHENGGDECYCDQEGRSYTSPDWQGPGYYRMLSPAGTQLPESTPGFGHCGTGATGWLRDEHPQDVNLEKNMTVCFDIGNDDDCIYTAEITVTNCDGYYVYMLPDTPGSNARYCASNKNIIF